MMKHRFFSVVMLVVTHSRPACCDRRCAMPTRLARRTGRRLRNGKRAAPSALRRHCPTSAASPSDRFRRRQHFRQAEVRQDTTTRSTAALGRSGIRSQRGISNAVGFRRDRQPDGYILTNNHVVTGEADSNTLTIRKTGCDRSPCRTSASCRQMIGTDPLTDLALLKIDANACRPCRGPTPRS